MVLWCIELAILDGKNIRVMEQHIYINVMGFRETSCFTRSKTNAILSDKCKWGYTRQTMVDDAFCGFGRFVFFSRGPSPKKQVIQWVSRYLGNKTSRFSRVSRYLGHISGEDVSIRILVPISLPLKPSTNDWDDDWDFPIGYH
jgi:hypothetical protein